MILIAALGDKPSTGYGVMVDSVAATKSNYLIFVRATDPGNCIVGGLVTQPGMSSWCRLVLYRLDLSRVRPRPGAEERSSSPPNAQPSSVSGVKLIGATVSTPGCARRESMKASRA